MRVTKSLVSAVFVILAGAPALAGEADVVKATINLAGDGSYALTATLRHGDEGWDHYADRWEVLDPDGTVLGVRELAHPHVNEQPFTRGLRGVKIPAGISTVTIRARDSQHGYGGKSVELAVPR